MGGFRLDEGNANPIPVAGSEHLINCANTWEIEGIPSEEFIMDKSKASPYAKSIAFLQVLWFVLQTITRIAQRLPLSILELSIVPYALMTLIAMPAHRSRSSQSSCTPEDEVTTISRLLHLLFWLALSGMEFLLSNDCRVLGLAHVCSPKWCHTIDNVAAGDDHV